MLGPIADAAHGNNVMFGYGSGPNNVEMKNGLG